MWVVFEVLGVAGLLASNLLFFDGKNNLTPKD